MSQVGSSLLDTITRIYKNSAGKVIGVHCISVHTYKDASPTGTVEDYPELAERRRRHTRVTDVFQRFNLDIGNARVIDSIQMLGGYDDFVENGSNNDIIQVTYFGRDDEGLENDIIIGLTEYPSIGDTL